MTLNIIAKLHKLLQLEDMDNTIKQQAEDIESLTTQVEDLRDMIKDIEVTSITQEDLERELEQVDYVSIINNLNIEIETTMRIR